MKPLKKTIMPAVLIHDFIYDELNIVSYIVKQPAGCKDRESVDLFFKVMKKQDIVESTNYIGEPIKLVKWN